MIHIVLHFGVPLIVAITIYRTRWRSAFTIMIATMVVDVDHLLANPIYDPNRCSIGFHPLHSTLAVVIYAALFLIPLWVGLTSENEMAEEATGDELRAPGPEIRPTSNKRLVLSPKTRVLHLIGLGLVIHMMLDWIDCLF